MTRFTDTGMTVIVSTLNSSPSLYLCLFFTTTLLYLFLSVLVTLLNMHPFLSHTKGPSTFSLCSFSVFSLFLFFFFSLLSVSIAICLLSCTERDVFYLSCRFVWAGKKWAVSMKAKKKQRKPQNCIILLFCCEKYYVSQWTTSCRVSLS